jgi:exonuclease VII large subunit
MFADWRCLAACCALFVLTLCLGAAIGYAVSQYFADGKIAAAVSAQDVCVSASDSQQAALKTLQDKLDAKARDLVAQKRAAAAALAARDTLQQKLTVATRERADAIKRLSHDKGNCGSFAGDAVCPAVAGKLWPALAHGDAATSH